MLDRRFSLFDKISYRVWHVAEPLNEKATKMTKTQQAINLIKTERITAYQAAKTIGISQAAISRELKRQRQLAAPKCPHCGK